MDFDCWLKLMRLEKSPFLKGLFYFMQVRLNNLDGIAIMD